MGAWRAFGMVLDTEDPVRFTADSFYCPVQQVPVGDGQTCSRKAVLFYGIGMVLGGDLNPAGQQVPDRMVASPVSELQLVGGGAAGKGNDLMAQADAKDWIFSAQGPDQLNGFFHICRISRPIGKKDTVRPAGGHFFCCGIPGKNSQAAFPAQNL